MTHEEILAMLGDYVDYLIANSSAKAPMWNIEKVRSGKPNKWNYIDGCMITACLSLYKTTGDEKYLNFSKSFIDSFVQEDGSIKTYDPKEYNLDNVNQGKNLFTLYDIFGDEKYRKAIETIRNCNLNRGHGGLVIGSEMSGGVKNVVMTQCLMDHTDRGLRIKTRRGRGKNAVIDGLVFRNVEMRHVLTPFVINMFYFCDPDGHGPYVQCRDAMPVDEYTPKLGSLTMEDIVATDAQFAGCYFDGLPEQPIERVSMKNVTITFDPNAEAGQAAMADNRPLVKKLAIYAENVKEIDLHNVKIEGYEGERLHFANVGHFEED